MKALQRPICAGIVLLFAGGCVRSPTEAISSGVYTRTFIEAWDAADSLFCSFPQKKIDWEQCYSHHMHLSQMALNDTEFRQVLLGLLGELKDHQACIVIDGERFDAYEGYFQNNFMFSTIFNYFQQYGGLTLDPGGFRYSDPSGGMPYLQFRYWNEESFSPERFHTVFDSLFLDADKLIIDVRMNDGLGEGMQCLEVAGRFSSTPWTGWYTSSRNGPSYDNLTPLQPFSVAPTGNVHFTCQVYLLTGGRCAESTEYFVCAMEALPNVTVIGERTRGSAGEAAYVPLSNGWVAGIPAQIVYSADMAPIQGQGISPDIEVLTSSEDLSGGIDPVLDYVFSLMQGV
ncbi:MAG: S41 family peptidase [Candidatus Fermentibacteraceae bacterium]